MIEAMRESRRISCYQCGKIILTKQATRRKFGSGDVVLTCGSTCKGKRVVKRKLIKRGKKT